MGKHRKVETQAEWEGGAAASQGKGRSTNPYPPSSPEARNEWFAGYDRVVQKLAREGGKLRFIY